MTWTLYSAMPQQSVKGTTNHFNRHLIVPQTTQECCVPTGCVLKELIHLDDLSNVCKVICNFDQCPISPFMHRECFEEWQESVLSYLRSTGRARSWSEKQRLQNLWTKKGYDLAYKACACRCGKGHIRKDLDWVPPADSVAVTLTEQRRRVRRKKGSERPTIALNSQQQAQLLKQQREQQQAPASPTGNVVTSTAMSSLTCRLRSSSLSSSGSVSPPSSEYMASPVHQRSPISVLPRSNINPFFNGDRERNSSGGLFSRRQDYSSFNALPWHKINSYHIKMEDDQAGNDDIRQFILSSFASQKTSRIPCCICHTSMNIFDRYPLLDGTLFLSPRQHSPGSVPTRVDASGRIQYLNGLCMRCLEGFQQLACRGCRTHWTGKHLILGTMYSYDVFAAQPCCEERLRCLRCGSLVITPDQRLRYFFSDYSHSLACPSCKLIDYHFVKPLGASYHQSTAQ